MLLTSPAVSLDLPKKAASKAHFEDGIRVMKDLFFDIDLFNTRVQSAEGCRLIATKLIDNL